MVNSEVYGLVTGHEGSVPQTRAEERQGLKEGLVSLDANVLLSFYRFSPKARQALVQILEALGDRVFVSHQAAREFWRNRLAAIDARNTASDQFSSALEKAERQVRDALRVWAKQTAADPSIEAQVLSAITTGLEACTKIVDDETMESTTFAYDAEQDSVVQDLAPLLADRVGAPLEGDAHESALQEAKRRAESGIPPGFQDIDKEARDEPDGLAGDYLVWLQSIEKAKLREVPLVLVTGDEKDDWWWKHRGHFLGPRQELVEEFKSLTGQNLIMLRPAQLIEHSDIFQIAVDEDVHSDVARGTASEPGAWTHRAVHELLRRLDSEGREQADVIRVAAGSGGSISRDRVYDVCGYRQDRMLRGFTRPTNRITSDLQLEDLLDYDVTPMLKPIYENGVTALRFELPKEVVDILAVNPEDDPQD